MHGVSAEVFSPNVLSAFGIVVFCVLLSGFFSGSETALTAASRARMHALERNGDERARTVNHLLETRSRLIGAMLLGNTLVNISASAFATNVLIGLFGDRGVLYATALITVLLLVFAEVLPKTLAIAYPDKMSLIIARPVGFFVAIFGPVLIGVEAVVRALLGLFGIDTSKQRSILSGSEELRSAVDLLHQEGTVGRSDRDMFGGLLELGDLTVSDVMIHRTKMRTINADLPPQEIIREALASPYTRMPLWHERPDNIVGVLHAKDLLRAFEAANGDGSKLAIDQIALIPWFVPDTTSLKDQLQAFLARKMHFALVVDEYGEVMGLVTLEDILEEIVGDIRDEHDVAMPGLRQLPDGSVNVEGSVPIRDLNRVMDWHLPDEEATTIAGLVIHDARAIPDTGQIFNFHGFRFEVLRKSGNRITALRVSPMARPDEEKDG